VEKVNEALKIMAKIFSSAIGAAGMVLIVNLFLKFIPQGVNELLQLIMGLILVLISMILSSAIGKSEKES